MLKNGVTARVDARSGERAFVHLAIVGVTLTESNHRRPIPLRWLAIPSEARTRRHRCCIGCEAPQPCSIVHGQREGVPALTAARTTRGRLGCYLAVKQ